MSNKDEQNQIVMLKIERKFEVVTETKRRIVIRQVPSVKQTFCDECGEPMLTIAQVAVLFGIKQSRIFQIVETGAAHFTEEEADALMICLSSLANFLKTIRKQECADLSAIIN